VKAAEAPAREPRSDLSKRAAVTAGLQRSLPLMLLGSFLLVPGTAARVFKTFLCDPFEFGEETTRRYLHDSLDVSCDADDYTATQFIAVVFVAIWPVGVPVLYSALLFASRESLQNGDQTRLSRATTFLSADYVSYAFWWEPVEMCRKLTLTGEGASCKSTIAAAATLFAGLKRHDLRIAVECVRNCEYAIPHRRLGALDRRGL
jgi:hypothetical protein